MKSKITRGAGFCGLIDYVFDIGINATGDKDARQIGGNMSGDNPRVLVAEFAALRRLRPDIDRPVWHSSLRLPPGDVISDEKWNEIIEDYLIRIGLDPSNHPYVVVRHNDSHVHIVSSRIAFDSSLYYGRNEHLISTRIVQQIEKDHGLTITKGPTYDKDGKIVMLDKSKLTSDEVKMTGRTGDIAPRQRLQEIITEAVIDRPTKDVFEKRLTDAGVSWRLSSNGYSYQLDGIAFKGSQLGQSFKWTQLQKSLILPEQEAKNDQDIPLRIADENYNNRNKQQVIYVAKAAAWESERKRRDKFRANRSIIYSVGQLSADILPRPLGDAVKIVAESMILIARISDWGKAHVYRREVKRLTLKMNQVKAERMKAAEKLAGQQPILNKNISTSQPPDATAYYPNRTASIIWNLASRTTNVELQAMFSKLADRVCKLPADMIIYKGHIDPYSPEFIKVVSRAIYPDRKQESKVETATAIESCIPKQTISSNEAVNTNVLRGRRR